jgi:hypothetical protein
VQLATRVAVERGDGAFVGDVAADGGHGHVMADDDAARFVGDLSL